MRKELRNLADAGSFLSSRRENDMKLVLKGGTVYTDGKWETRDFPVETDAPSLFSDFSDLSGCYIFPGFADVHVHLREPGFSYKETVKSGTAAGAAGGYTALCAMPNLNPVPDSVGHLEEELAPIRRDACIEVLPFGAITVGEKGEELSDMEGMAPFVCGFSDDGKGVQDAGKMREAMKRAAALGKPISAHCEDNSLLAGGYIHKGRYAEAHGHRGICSESEWRPIERDLKLAEETGCAYHVCHISCRESVELIREAKKSGVNVTCETAPHYLLLCEDDLREDGFFKMNPPLRGREDREALLEGLFDGTVDMIATDHAPHSAEEKSCGLEKSLMGVTGLEVSFPMLYTELVKKGYLSLERLIFLMSEAPRKRFSIGSDRGFAVWDLSGEREVDPASFLSQGHATPFIGRRVSATCLLTVYKGRPVYKRGRA